MACNNLRCNCTNCTNDNCKCDNKKVCKCKPEEPTCCCKKK